MQPAQAHQMSQLCAHSDPACCLKLLTGSAVQCSAVQCSAVQCSAGGGGPGRVLRVPESVEPSGVQDPVAPRRLHRGAQHAGTGGASFFLSFFLFSFYLLV